MMFIVELLYQEHPLLLFPSPGSSRLDDFL